MNSEKHAERSKDFQEVATSIGASKAGLNAGCKKEKVESRWGLNG